MSDRRSYGSRKSRRLPDTYGFETIRAVPHQPSAVVSLTQFEFLDGADPEDLRPRGQGVKNRDTRRKPPVTRETRKWRSGGR